MMKHFTLQILRPFRFFHEFTHNDTCSFYLHIRHPQLFFDPVLLLFSSFIISKLSNVNIVNEFKLQKWTFYVWRNKFNSRLNQIGESDQLNILHNMNLTTSENDCLAFRNFFAHFLVKFWRRKYVCRST